YEYHLSLVGYEMCIRGNHKTLGVIGADRIGLGVAKRAQSFGMKILAFDPYLTDEKAKSLSITKATVDEIAQHSDFVTLHTPLT
ncbi:hypothetical protein DD924_19220, partial [Staphylococcus pseudintermedius]